MYISAVCIVLIRCSKVAFLRTLQLNVCILELGNHLSAAKSSCKTICFWRSMWNLMYNMEKPISHRMSKPSVARWILKVFGLCAMNPCREIRQADSMQLLESHLMPVKLLLKTGTKLSIYVS